MSNTFFKHDGSGSELPDNPLDEAVDDVEQAAHDLGLKSGDRMFVFYHTMMVLVRALVWSLKTNHEANERALAVLQERQKAALEVIQLQSTQFRAKLDEQAVDQRRRADRYFEELKRQREELLAKHDIADQSKSFFEKFKNLINEHVDNFGKANRKHVEDLHDLNDRLKTYITSSVVEIPLGLAKSIAIELQNEEIIVRSVTEKISGSLSKVVSDNMLYYLSKIIVVVVIVFGLGMATDRWLLSASSPVQTGSTVHGGPLR